MIRHALALTAAAMLSAIALGALATAYAARASRPAPARCYEVSGAVLATDECLERHYGKPFYFEGE